MQDMQGMEPLLNDQRLGRWQQAIKNFFSPQDQTDSIDLLNQDYKNYLLSTFENDPEKQKNYLNGNFEYDFHDMETLITFIEDRAKQARIIKYLQERRGLAKEKNKFSIKGKVFVDIINYAHDNNVKFGKEDIKYALKLCSLVDCKEIMQRKHNESEKNNLAYVFGNLDANQLFGGIQQNVKNTLQIQIDNENILSNSNFFLLYCITRNNDKLLGENQVDQLTNKMCENNFSMTEDKIYIFSLFVLSLAQNSVSADSATRIFNFFALEKNTDMLHMIPQYVWLHFFGACQKGALGLEWAHTLSFDLPHPYNIPFNSKNYEPVMQAFSTKKEGCRTEDIPRFIVGKKIFINLEYQNRIGKNVGKGGIWTGIALIVAGTILQFLFGPVLALSFIGTGIGIIAGFGGITYHNNKQISKENEKLNDYKNDLTRAQNSEEQHKIKTPIPTRIENATQKANKQNPNNNKTKDENMIID